MNRCPKCNHYYDELTAFCIEDGSALICLVPQSSQEMPTQVVSSARDTLNEDRDRNKLHYVVGGFVAIFLGLIAVVFFWQGDPKSLNKNNESPRSTALDVDNTERSNALDIGSLETNALTEADAKELVSRWRNAQIEKDFGAYRTCYTQTPEFIGIKALPGGRRQQMNMNNWLADRRRMYRKVIDLQILVPVYSIDGEVVVVRFRQKWRSVNHCDIGEKLLRIKMIADQPKIVFEELRTALSCV